MTCRRLLACISLLATLTLAQRLKFTNGVSGIFNRKIEPVNIQKLALQDSIGKEWLSYGARRMHTPSAKKFAQIKTMILSYQKWQSFGKFDYYGCYCFPEGLNLAIGRGNPIDEIDSACKRWHTCYQCASLDPQLSNATSSCDGNAQPYKFFGGLDEHNLPKVSCGSNGGHDTCSRAVCECDAELIKSLAKYEDKHNIEYHQVWGNFQTAKCFEKDLPPVKLKSAGDNNAKLRSAAQESLDIQLDKSDKSKSGREDRGMIDSCCVKEYPKFTLYRSTSQHCCKSEIDSSLLANVFHNGEDHHGNSFVCCKDGHVVKSTSDCTAGRHTEF